MLASFIEQAISPMEVMTDAICEIIRTIRRSYRSANWPGRNRQRHHRDRLQQAHPAEHQRVAGLAIQVPPDARRSGSAGRPPRMSMPMRKSGKRAAAMRSTDHRVVRRSWLCPFGNAATAADSVKRASLYRSGEPSGKSLPRRLENQLMLNLRPRAIEARPQRGIGQRFAHDIRQGDARPARLQRQLFRP